MRNYVIINGVNSLTIQGLAINNLPPITKPMIRTQREEIDGRDGDIVTELGYSAYDKQIEIGLWGTYDINDIIKYFTGEGTIVFSNESDKYYNFKILDQIDYEKLLKFKTATITLHCQPFKYPVEETPIEGEAITITGSGSNITLENTVVAPMEIALKGNTSQNTTTGKNLFNKYGSLNDGGGKPNTVSLNSQGQIVTTANYNEWRGRGQLIENLSTNTDYTISGTLISTTGNGNVTLQILTTSSVVIDTVSIAITVTKPYQFSSTFNTGENTSILISFSGNDIDLTVRPTTIFDNIQVEKGSTATTYEPYTNGASPNPDYPQDIHVVSGDNSIVVCGKNLFDKDNNVLNAYINATGYVLTSDASMKVAYAPCEPNTTYTISKVQSARFIIASYSSLTFGTGSTNGTSDNSATHLTLTTDENAKYLCVFYYHTSDTLSEETIRNSIQIEKGSTATTYEAYQSTSYPISLSSNLLYNESLPKVQASVIADYVQGIFSLKGTSSGASNLYIIPYATSMTHIEAGESITFYIERVSGTSVVKFLSYFVPDDGSSSDFTWGITLNANTSSNKVVKTATKAGNLKNVQFFLDSGVAYDSEVKILVKKGNIENPVWQPYMTPIELCKIGTYQDKIDKSSGKNLIPFTNQDFTLNNVRYYAQSNSLMLNGTSSGETSSVNTNFKDNFSFTLKSGTYTISHKTGIMACYLYKYDDNTLIKTLGTDTATQTFTLAEETTLYIGFYVYQKTFSNVNTEIMIEAGTITTPVYEPYGTSWYLKKEIGKVVLDGSETWTYESLSGYDVFKYTENNMLTQNSGYGISNRYRAKELSEQPTNGVARFGWSSKVIYFYNDTSIASGNINTWKTWLSSNNVEVIYPLATPTYTLIEDTTLISQLEALKPYSYNPTTNITQTNDDAPFELDVSLSYTNTMNVNNIGNIYAKPILTIEGSGTIGIILNDIEILSVDLGTDEKVTIDVPKLEAYNPDDDTLLNRNVTGDYMKLLIQEGNNTIAFSGSVTSATLTNYNRWI